jgi:hypothetical protein
VKALQSGVTLNRRAALCAGAAALAQAAATAIPIFWPGH